MRVRCLDCRRQPLRIALVAEKNNKFANNNAAMFWREDAEKN